MVESVTFFPGRRQHQRAGGRGRRQQEPFCRIVLKPTPPSLRSIPEGKTVDVAGAGGAGEGATFNGGGGGSDMTTDTMDIATARFSRLLNRVCAACNMHRSAGDFWHPVDLTEFPTCVRCVSCVSCVSCVCCVRACVHACLRACVRTTTTTTITTTTTHEVGGRHR